jgi:hypothetical protein
MSYRSSYDSQPPHYLNFKRHNLLEIPKTPPG